MASADRFLPEFPDGPDDLFDVVIVTGDAYVDHPAFGAAIIGRYIESLGYRVGILAQPDWKSEKDFKRFGKPRLFFGVTGGNLDSMVSNYTPHRTRRKHDVYSPGGKPGLRPDLASVVYAQCAKRAYPDTKVVMGGVEASLRKFTHYDFVQQKVRRSVLADAKADYLVYGMAETTLGKLAEMLDNGDQEEDIRYLPGLAYRTTEPVEGDRVVVLPDSEEAGADKEKFLEAFALMDKAANSMKPPTLVQRSGGVAVVANPPPEPIEPVELDKLYRLPFARAYPERYEELGGVPALETVRHSVVTHRGCYGGCSFCAISAHQGSVVVSRPIEGIVAEVKRLAERSDFRGTITDLGGPTANMYGTYCSVAEESGRGCSRPSCLVPEPCAKLKSSGAPYVEALRKARRVPKVKNVFVGSGLRHDMLIMPGQRRLMRELMQYHVGGQMKVAPEHAANRPLKLMGKPQVYVWRTFQKLFDSIKAEIGKDIYLVPYLMTGHPGTDLRDAADLAKFVKGFGHAPEQVQGFTPTPGTRSSCMYHTGHNPLNGEEVIVVGEREGKLQRALAQYKTPANKKRIVVELRERGWNSILRELYGSDLKIGTDKTKRLRDLGKLAGGGDKKRSRFGAKERKRGGHANTGPGRKGRG